MLDTSKILSNVFKNASMLVPLLFCFDLAIDTRVFLSLWGMQEQCQLHWNKLHSSTLCRGDWKAKNFKNCKMAIIDVRDCRCFVQFMYMCGRYSKFSITNNHFLIMIDSNMRVITVFHNKFFSEKSNCNSHLFSIYKFINFISSDQYLCGSISCVVGMNHMFQQIMLHTCKHTI